MLLSDRLVEFELPLVVRHNADSNAFGPVMRIWILPQLCWNVLAPPP